MQKSFIKFSPGYRTVEREGEGGFENNSSNWKIRTEPGEYLRHECERAPSRKRIEQQKIQFRMLFLFFHWINFEFTRAIMTAIIKMHSHTLLSTLSLRWLHWTKRRQQRKKLYHFGFLCCPLVPMLLRWSVRCIVLVIELFFHCFWFELYMRATATQYLSHS